MVTVVTNFIQFIKETFESYPKTSRNSLETITSVPTSKKAYKSSPNIQKVSLWNMNIAGDNLDTTYNIALNVDSLPTWEMSCWGRLKQDVCWQYLIVTLFYRTTSFCNNFVVIFDCVPAVHSNTKCNVQYNTSWWLTIWWVFIAGPCHHKNTLSKLTMSSYTVEPWDHLC